MEGLLGFLRLGPGAPGRSRPTPAEQEDALRSWAQRHDHQLTAFVRDDAPSDELGHRPVLLEALARVRDRSVAGLAVFRLGCLADDVARQEHLREEVRRMGGTLLCAEEPDAGDVHRQTVRDVLRSLATDELALAALRAGLLAPRAGGPVGSPAFGYHVDGGALVPHPDEQVVLARILELRAAGVTLRTMARVLAAEGHRPKRGERWHPESLRRILRRAQRDAAPA